MPDRDEPQIERPEAPLERVDIPETELPETEADATATGPTRTVTARGVLLVGARAVAGTIGIAVTAATVLAATFLPLPSHQVAPIATTVTPVPAAQQRACAGPLLRLGDETGGSATVASAVGTPQLRQLANEGTVELSRIGATDEPSGNSATVLTLPAAEATSGEASSGEQRLLSGSQTQLADSVDIAGLAAAECVEARSETWLVGGSTGTGRTTLLTLTNPGPVTASVDLTIFSEDGRVEAPGTEGIVVQPNSERSFSLAGFAPGVIAPVVKVVSGGGSIVASLQQSTVRILEPGGIDIVGPSAAPATEVVIPGLVVSEHELLEERVGAPGYDDIEPVLRIFVPGDKAAAATITVTPEGEGAELSVDFDLMAGKVTELPLDHFEDGSYTVSITADVPLVAGVRATVVGASGASDFVWLESAEVMRGVALANLPAGPGAALHLANAMAKDAVVTITSAKESQKVTVPAGKSVTVPVEASASYELRGFDALRVAASYTGDGLVSGFTLSPTGPAARPITVYR